MSLATSEPRMNFLSGLIVARKPPHLTHWTLNEYTATLAAVLNPHFNERLQAGDKTKPFFDSDNNYSAPPDRAEKDRVFQCFKSNIHDLLADQPGFLPEHVVYGKRHGITPTHPDRPFKISFRAWLPGYKVAYTHLGQWIESKGLAGAGDGKLDCSIYKPGEQLLACMGCSKGNVLVSKGVFADDNRILRPVGAMQDLQSYLVQHLKGDEVELLLPPRLQVMPEPALPVTPTQQAGELTTATNPVDTEHVKKILGLLNANRWDGRSQWVDYGIALKTFGGDSLKEAWLEGSQRSKMFNSLDAEKTWASFGKAVFTCKPITFATICQHAKIDNPLGFAKLNSERSGSPLEKAMGHAVATDGSCVALAQVVYAVLGDSYRTMKVSSGRVWFYFDGNRWNKRDDGQVLRDITDKVYPVFQGKVRQVEDRIAQSTEPGMKEPLEKRKAMYQKLANKLLDRTKRTAVIAEFAPLVQDPEFEQKLDRNVNLLGFEDCVYDFRTGKPRPGEPGDYISKSVGYNFPRESGGYEAEIDDFCRKVWPGAEVRNYVLDMLAQKLCGAHIKSICIHTGLGGDNGKTTALEGLILEVYGGYGVKAKIALFTQKRQAAGQADPDTAELVGVRYVFAEEPEEDVRLNSGFLKDISGGGRMKFRLLFSNDLLSVVPQFVIHLACNKMPQIDGTDGGLSNRLHKIDYCSKFVRTEAEVDEGGHRYLRDCTISDRFTAWAPDFMRMLLARYIHGQEPAVPLSVIESTGKYMDVNNDFMTFKEHFLEVGKAWDNFIPNEALARWREYQTAETLGLSKVPSKLKLIESLTVLLGAMLVADRKLQDDNGAVVRRRDAWWGWRLLDEPAKAKEDSREEEGSNDA